MSGRLICRSSHHRATGTAVGPCVYASCVRGNETGVCWTCVYPTCPLNGRAISFSPYPWTGACPRACRRLICVSRPCLTVSPGARTARWRASPLSAAAVSPSLAAKPSQSLWDLPAPLVRVIYGAPLIDVGCRAVPVSRVLAGAPGRSLSAHLDAVEIGNGVVTAV